MRREGPQASAGGAATTLFLAVACLAALGLVMLAVPRTAAQSAGPAEWPQWRGPNRDGVSRETGLLKAWPRGGPALAWKTSGAHAGYSSMAVSGGRLVTLGANGDTEYVVAFDAATGRKLWQTPNGRRYRNDRGDGPRSTPTVDGTTLYVLGASGDVSALDAASGQVRWTLNVLSKFGGQNPNWGLSESPLVLPDRVLVNAGGRGASIVALRKTDGSLLWQSQDDGAGYSSAVLGELGPIRQAVFFTSRRVMGVDVSDGRLLWSYDKVSNRTANIATPLVRANRVFVSSDYGTGGALLQLDLEGSTVSATEVWFNRDMRNHHSSSVWIGRHLYGFSSAILTALEVDTGAVAWKDRSVGKGSLVYADERLYLFGEDGTVALAEANPTAYREHGRFSLTIGGLPSWSHPVVAGGRLYLRDQDTIHAYDVKAK